MREEPSVFPQEQLAPENDGFSEFVERRFRSRNRVVPGRHFLQEYALGLVHFTGYGVQGVGKPVVQQRE